jgi:hypothetical protein
MSGAAEIHHAAAVIADFQQQARMLLPKDGHRPIQLIAVEGMRRYGYAAEADRVSTEFLSTVLENFERNKRIRDKYNVVTRSSETKCDGGVCRECNWF